MKNTLKSRIAILCIVGSLFVIPASNSFGDDFVTSVGAGSKAMLFTFSGLSVLGASAFDGGFGAKYYLSDPLAIRAALIYATAFQDVEPAAVPTGASVQVGSQSGTRLGLAAAAEYHFLKTRVSPYAGGGLGIAYSFTKYKTAETTVAPAPFPEPDVTDNRSTGETIGANTFFGGTAFNIGALAGVEFFIVKEVSLSAEYQLGYTLNARADQKYTTTAGTTTTTTTTKVAASSLIGITSAGTLTLSVYF